MNQACLKALLVLLRRSPMEVRLTVSNFTRCDKGLRAVRQQAAVGLRCRGVRVQGGIQGALKLPHSFREGDQLEVNVQTDVHDDTKAGREDAMNQACLKALLLVLLRRSPMEVRLTASNFTRCDEGLRAARQAAIGSRCRGCAAGGYRDRSKGPGAAGSRVQGATGQGGSRVQGSRCRGFKGRRVQMPRVQGSKGPRVKGPNLLGIELL